MAPRRTAKGKAAAATATATPKSSSVDPPAPFKTAPDSLRPFFDELSPRHVYIAHIDSHPRSFKRKLFMVPVLLNAVVALLMILRVWYIGPYYLLLLETTLGSANKTTLVARDLPWRDLIFVVLRRGFTFMFDLCLIIFVWPWPFEFCFGTKHGSPVWWRWSVGFRDKEIYVRRSRSWYVPAGSTGPRTPVSTSPTPAKIDITDPESRAFLVPYLRQATSPLLIQQKTGYITMDNQWDLDWELMVWATTLVDKKELALEAFSTVVLLHHNVYGWLCVDRSVLNGSSGVSSAVEDERRRQVFAFRDALAAIGKEDLFFRWIEIIQFETSRPGGLHSDQKKADVAKQVRDLFESNGVDFDGLWKETVGSEGLVGM